MPKHKESVNRACHYSSKLIVKFFSAEGKNELELFVPQQQKTAIQADSGVLIVFLVAGAGFVKTLRLALGYDFQHQFTVTQKFST